MAGMFKNQHSALVHVEPIDSDEEEVVTIVEKEKVDLAKKLVVVTDKFRTVNKNLEVDSLKDFLCQGRDTLGYMEDEEVYAVLEEDGTEVDEDEYFHLLPARTFLMVLSCSEVWSPSLSLQGSCMMEPGSILSSSQLATALLEHLKRSNLELGEQVGDQRTSLVDLLEDDFPVEIVSQNTQNIQNAF